MRRQSRLRRAARDESGMVLALMALGIVVLLGATALAIDMGMLMTARTESQRVADLSALAGAGSLAFSPNNVPLARQTATTFAAQNEVRNTPVTLQPSDVQVITDSQKVRVTVVHTATRGNPVSTIFARILGINTVDVVTVAAAEAYPAGSVNCQSLLPVALADRWVNFGTPEWNPAEGDYYQPWSPTDPGTAYTQGDIGTPLVLKPSQGGTAPGPKTGGFEPGWWYLWTPNGGGAAAVRDHILGAGRCNTEVSVGDRLTDQNGNVQSIVRAFRDLIAREPNHRYDHTCQCIVDGSGSQVAGSVRWRAVPMFAPPSYTKQGAGPNFQVSNFAGVFIDSLSSGPQGQQHVYATFMGFTAYDAVGSGGDGSPAGPLVKVLRLVE